MTDEAKMTGITPAMLTLSGMNVLSPPIIRRPTTRLAYCTGTRRSPVVIQITPTTTASAMTRNRTIGSRLKREELRRARRDARDDADEDDDRHAVADAARRDELAEPHDDDGAGDEAGHDQESRATR